MKLRRERRTTSVKSDKQSHAKKHASDATFTQQLPTEPANLLLADDEQAKLRALSAAKAAKTRT